MKRITKILTICCVVVLQNFAFSQTVEETRAKEIIEKAITVSGGKELLTGIKTLYTKASTVMDGRNVYYITKEMEPNLGSFEIEYQGRIVYRSWFDGTTGYDTVNGQKKVADQEEFKDKHERKYIMNEIAYLDPTLYKVKFIKTDTNQKINQVEATAKDGSVTDLFYDTESFLLKKEEKKNASKNSFSTVLCTEYKKFGDLTYCSKHIFKSENGDQITNLIDLKYNKGIKKSDFKY
nr:hypothetical protein [uncultured Chryseobacterium sp.]